MRLLCGEARVQWDRIRSGKTGPDDWSRIVQAADALHDAPMYVVDAGNVTIVDIRARARRLRSSRKGLGLIIVDYLQLMSHHTRVDSRQQEIAEISRGLKLLAKELDIPRSRSSTATPNDARTSARSSPTSASPERSNRTPTS